MNYNLPVRISWLVSLTALTFLSSTLSAKAEVTQSVKAETTTPQSKQSVKAETLAPQSTPTSVSVVTPTTSDSSVLPVANNGKQIPTQEAKFPSSDVQPTLPAVATTAPATPVGKDLASQQIADSQTKATNENLKFKPILSNLNTSAAALKTEPVTSQLPPAAFTTSQLPEVRSQEWKVAQSDINVNPGRPTQSGSSYVGIAGNIGLSGDSALSDTNFAVISKIGLTRQLSFRLRLSLEITQSSYYHLLTTLDSSQETHWELCHLLLL
jgi:hypothetical protein